MKANHRAPRPPTHTTTPILQKCSLYFIKLSQNRSRAPRLLQARRRRCSIFDSHQVGSIEYAGEQNKIFIFSGRRRADGAAPARATAYEDKRSYLRATAKGSKPRRRHDAKHGHVDSLKYRYESAALAGGFGTTAMPNALMRRRGHRVRCVMP